MARPTSKFFRDLRRAMLKCVYNEDLKRLCLDLGLESDDLPQEKARFYKFFRLLNQLEHDGRIPDLLNILKENWPQNNWPALPVGETATLTVDDHPSAREQCQNLCQFRRNVGRQAPPRKYGRFLRQQILKRSSRGSSIQNLVNCAFAAMNNHRRSVIVDYLIEFDLLPFIRLPESVDLSGLNLPQKNLIRSHMRRANLQQTNLSESNLFQADLGDADLRNAVLRNADLRYANLSWTNLEGANLSRADLRGANLSGANLSRAILSRADLRHAWLSGTEFFQAELRAVKIEGRQLEQAKTLDQATMPNGRPYQYTVPLQNQIHP